MKIELAEIASRIKQLRKGLNLSQSEFAKKVNANNKINVSQWENARAIPNYKQLLEITRLTNTTIDWIITGKGEQHASLIVKEMQERQKELDAEKQKAITELETENQHLREELSRKLLPYGKVAEKKEEYPQNN